MFENYPIQVSLTSVDELQERIEAIKEIHDSGVTLTDFEYVITNLRNGLDRNSERNEFSIVGWVGFFETQFHPLMITEVQLQLIFDYLTSYVVGLIGISDVEYFTMNADQKRFDDAFFIEFFIFKTLEA